MTNTGPAANERFIAKECLLGILRIYHGLGSKVKFSTKYDGMFKITINIALLYTIYISFYMILKACRAIFLQVGSSIKGSHLSLPNFCLVKSFKRDKNLY